MDLNEKFLYHIWDAGHLQYELKAISGKSIRVKFQGQYNTGRGPDFSFAIINIDGQDIQGNVEIHLKSSDWMAHGHDEDQFYNGVVLHVVLMHNQNQSYTIREDGEIVEILELQNQLSLDISKLLQDGVSQVSPGLNTYCDLLSAIDKDNLELRLLTNGKNRFLSKVKRFNAVLGISNFDQVLYEGLLEALGYDKNKLNFYSLAQSLPFAVVKEWKADGLTLTELVSIFLFSSGLLRKAPQILGDDLFQSLSRNYENQTHFAKTLSIDWQLFRIRPGAHPVYRLIAFLALIYPMLEEGLLKSFIKILEPPDRALARCAILKQKISSSTPPEFDSLPKPGKDVLNAMLLNIYLPVLYLWYDKQAMGMERKQILSDYLRFPPLQENYVIRSMQRHINPSQLKLINSKAVYQQGLQDLYNRHCKYHLCEQCLEYQKSLNC